MTPAHIAALRSVFEIELEEDRAQALELLRKHFGIELGHEHGQAELGIEGEQDKRRQISYRIPSLGYALAPWREEEGWPLGGPVESE